MTKVKRMGRREEKRGKEGKVYRKCRRREEGKGGQGEDLHITVFPFAEESCYLSTTRRYPNAH